MSIKLKSIEIEAFRAYKEKQVFNFECQSGRLANLIVLYAPNGFGKTSFFDALEWGVTGKINRISSNTSVRNIAEEEQGNILKNIESNNKYGTVKIIGEKDNILEVQTKVIGVHNRKTDYCPGELKNITSVFEKLQRTDFCSTNLLAHDKIDAFLRFSTPRERYETLSSFWDINKDTDTYKAILAIYKESVKKEEELKTEVANIRSELAALSFSPDKVKYLLSLIKGFNSKYNLTLDETLESDIKNNLDKCLNYKTQVTNSNAKLKERVIVINSLTQEFPQYNENIMELKSLREKTGEIINLINKFTELTKKEKQLIDLEDISKNYKSKLEKYNELIINWNHFESIDKSISELYSNNLLISKEIGELSEKNTKYEVDILNSEITTKDLIAKQDLYLKIYNEIDSKYQYYKIIKNNEDWQSKRINVLNKLIKKRTERIDLYIVRSNELASYIKLDDRILPESNYNYHKFIKEFITCRDLYSESKKIIKLLDEKEKEYIEFGKLNDQLNEVIKHGKAFIEQTKVKKCPLCNKDYDNFESLLNNVNSSFGDILSVNKILVEITSLKELQESNIICFKNAIAEFRSMIENEIREINYKVSDEKLKIEKNQNLIFRKNNKIKEYLLQANDIKQYFTKINTDIDNCNVHDVKREILLMNEKQRILIVEQKQRIEELKGALKQNYETIINKKNLIEIGNAKASELTCDPKYVQISSILTQLGIKKDSADLKEQIRHLESLLMKQDADIVMLKLEISTLSNELSNRNNDELEKNLVACKNETVRVDNQIKGFESRYRNIIAEDGKEISITVLEELKLLTEGEIKVNDTMLSSLIEIIEHLDYLQNNKEWIEKSRKHKETSEKLRLISLAKTELENDKDISINYITDRINNYFNLNIINQIYEKIDPHPNLTYVKFEPVFTKDVPELSIHAYSDDGKEKLSPILYLSSAQVNILSLSIFLARALQNNSNILNTIFMDDPIQHLDSINILSFIDLLRTITTVMDRQVILSTHNDSFYRLIKKKIDPEYFNAKYLELGTYGIVEMGH